MSDKEAQENEILALEAIFEEGDCLRINNRPLQRLLAQMSQEDNHNDNSDTSEPPVNDDQLLLSGDFSAHPQLPETFTVIDGEETHTLKYLPPIVLGFQLPTNYPSEEAPEYKLTCSFLTTKQLSLLCGHLDSLWRYGRGSEILYRWIDFLQQDGLNCLGIHDTLVLEKPTGVGPDIDQRCFQDVNSANQVMPLLLENNLVQLQIEFEKSSWLCGVCFDERPGKECFRFYECEHVYCRDCMVQHFSVRVQDGEVNNLRCPHDQCETIAHPTQLKAVLPSEVYERYEHLLLHYTLGSMGDIDNCPRPSCQTPVLLEDAETMAQCPKCGFAYCKLCKKSYHGVDPCDIPEDILKVKLTVSSEEELEAFKRKYGQNFVESLLKEMANHKWIETNAKMCPQCHIRVSKGGGCNKMTCPRCRVYFCWLCQSILPRFDPYQHFWRGNDCALFPGEEDIDAEDIDHQALLEEDYEEFLL